MQLGRIQAMVPDVTGLAPSSWAMPCVPVAGIQNGIFTVPQIGSGVWIEFEQGDPDYPIWVGCFWGTAAEVPALALTVPPGRARHHVADAAAERPDDQRRAGADRRHHAQEHDRRHDLVNDIGINISNGKGASIIMVGPSTDINAGALTMI